MRIGVHMWFVHGIHVVVHNDRGTGSLFVSNMALPACILFATKDVHVHSESMVCGIAFWNARHTTSSATDTDISSDLKDS